LSAGIFEEIGWTGFAIPTLRRRCTLLTTGLIVGALWGAWHLLTNVLWAANVSAGDLPLSIYLSASIAGVLIGYLPAFRVLMVWVYEHTGSVLIAMLMHVSLTTSVIALTPTLTGVSVLLCSYAMAATMWIVVAAIAFLNRRRVSPRPLRRAA
jgi:membrane protease YdiL (CAAX protease family)